MQGNKSEVARLRQQIEQEYESMQLGFSGYAMTARHDIINNKFGSIDDLRSKLSDLVGSEQAMQIIVEVNDRFAPEQK